MRRRGLLVGAWALSTIAATLVGWVAVRQVTDQVSPATVLPLPSAVALVEGSSETAVVTPAATDAATAGPRRKGRRPNVQTEQNRPRTHDDGVAGTPTSPPPQPDPPAPQENPQPAAVTEAYELVGGAVTVRYRDGSTTLISATPNSGFDVDVNDGGPEKVDVRFRSDEHESRLVTRWRAGAPDPRREEQPR